MSFPPSAFLAISLYVAGALVGRSFLHYARTGSFGVHGIRGATGSLARGAGVAMIVAMLGLALAPLAVWRGLLPVLVIAEPWQTVGWVLFAIGSGLTLLSQLQMGDSWRVGVREGEQTELVTAGLFAWCRNPIFTAMLLTTLAIVVWFPSPIVAVAWATLLIAIEIQVRHVEEPHLVRVHGDAYRRYAACTGRFLPGIGRGVGRSAT